MGAMIHFGGDGWRARLDGDFTEENVVRIAAAAAACWRQRAGRGNTVYVGYDARPEAPRFARLAAEVLAGQGLEAVLSDVPAPTAALVCSMAQDARACGSFMVTGGHHPLDYLGVKLRAAEGSVREFYDEVEGHIASGAVSGRGAFRRAGVIDSYISRLTSLVSSDAIARSGLDVVVDAMFGAGGGHLARALRKLGATVHEIRLADGTVRDVRSEPVEPWVDECEHAVVGRGAMAGLALDGDGSRLGVVDDKGRYVGPQKVAALLLAHLVRNQGLTGRIVTDLTVSTLVRRVADALGCRLTMRPIGFHHIYEGMGKSGALLGADGEGGVIIPAHLVERDALLGGLLLCELLAIEGRPLSALVDELDEAYGSFSYARRDVRAEPEMVEALRTVLPGLNPPEFAGRQPVAVSHMDGLRLEFEDGAWLLMRPSSSEPMVRICAEAPTIEMRDALLEAAMAAAHGES